MRTWRPVPDGFEYRSIGSYCGLSLLMSGDVSMNPDPPRTWKCPCGTCQKPVKSNQDGLQCDSCDTWFHLRCLPDAISISRAEYSRLSQTTENWYCYECQLPTLTDSFFSTATTDDDTSHTDAFDETRNSHSNDPFLETSDVSDADNLFNVLQTVRGKCRKNVIISHINSQCPL